MSHNVETMFSVRKTPWHQLGTVLEDAPTSADAIAEAGLNWEVALRNIYWDKTDEIIDEPRLASVVKIPRKKVLLRTSDESPFAIVSDSYQPLQNKEAFEWFDPIVSDGLATYETAGSLCGGKKIWILAKLGENMEIVSGDEVRRYLLLCNGHDGMTGIMIQPTPIRVVCQNTLNASLGAGMVKTIYHQGGIKDKMDKVRQLLGLAEIQFDESRELYKEMAKLQVTTDDIGSYLRSLIPDANEDATERVKNSVDLSRRRIQMLHETGMGADIPGVRGTVWGIYNAAIEYADYDMPKRVRDLGNYQLFGMGAQFKKRAFDKASELVTA